MDDLTLFHRDLDSLKKMIAPIDAWIKTNRRQELNHSKTSISSLRKGIDYLGYRIIQGDQPKNPARIQSTKKRKWAFVQDLRKLEKFSTPDGEFLHPLSPIINYKKARLRLASINSRIGLFKNTDSFRFKSRALTKLKINQQETWVTLDEESGASFYEFSKLKIKSDLSAVILP